jgi:hypothetical protein
MMILVFRDYQLGKRVSINSDFVISATESVMVDGRDSVVFNMSAGPNLQHYWAGTLSMVNDAIKERMSSNGILILPTQVDPIAPPPETPIEEPNEG